MSSDEAPPPPMGDRRSPELREASWLTLMLAGRLRESFDEQAAALELSHTAIKVLLDLDPERPVPMRSLAGRLRFDPSNLTSVVDRLEHRGLVTRRQDPGDRRVKALVLTDEGVRAREAFWQRLRETPGPLGMLGERELRQYLELLRSAIARSDADHQD